MIKRATAVFIVLVFIVSSFASCGGNPATVAPLSDDDFIIEGDAGSYWGSNDISKVLTNSGDYRWVFYDPNADESKDGVICTARGIHLGASVDDVIEAYGDAEIKTLAIQNDLIYQQVLLAGSEEEKNHYKENCLTSVKYHMDNGSLGIIFYFDKQEEVSTIVFGNWSDKQLNEEPSGDLCLDDFIVDGEIKNDILGNDVSEYTQSVGSFVYTYFNPELYENKEGVICTARGISLGDSIDDVKAKYGDENEKTFNPLKDTWYKKILELGDEKASIYMSENCSTYVQYFNKDENRGIIFYFDDQKNVSAIVFACWLQINLTL